MPNTSIDCFDGIEPVVRGFFRVTFVGTF